MKSTINGMEVEKRRNLLENKTVESKENINIDLKIDDLRDSQPFQLVISLKVFRTHLQHKQNSVSLSAS
jgi:hypothetical protein